MARDNDNTQDSSGNNGITGGSSDDSEVETPSRDEVLALLEDGLREAHRKATSGRVRDAENEKVRQGWIRVLAYTAGQYRQIKKDEDLEDLEERLEALELANEPSQFKLK